MAPPPEEWTPRSDASTRKVIDRLDRLTADVEGLEEALMLKLTEWLAQQLKAYVNWPAFAGILVGFLGLAALVATAIASPAKDRAQTVEQRQDKLEDATAKKLEKLVDAVGKLEIAAAEQRATYRVVVEGVSRAAARAEVPRTTADR